MLIFLFLCLIVFFYWQFKMIRKYSFQYDKFKINIPQRNVCINGETVSFKEIDHICVLELEQPSTTEKAFSKTAYHTYLTKMIFHLKNGTAVSCRFNSKGALYKALKRLQPFVAIYENIEQYKISIFWRIIVFLAFVILGIMWGLSAR
ncbi:MAG: hypothetical protein IKW63_02130 [Elusimicrobiaceae bacterium]|nr:hypothetical protein [Elusimicrobiaceae bacterium]